MTNDELQQKLDALAKKRDHCTDVLGKPMLGWTYQNEIDALIAKHPQAIGEGL